MVTLLEERWTLQADKTHDETTAEPEWASTFFFDVSSRRADGGSAAVRPAAVVDAIGLVILVTGFLVLHVWMVLRASTEARSWDLRISLRPCHRPCHHCC
jgi:hypothetical protein